MSKLQKKVGLLLAVSLLVALFVAGCTKPAPENGEGEGKATWPKRVSIAASSPGGGFYMGASAVAAVINNYMEGVDAVVEITGASRHNVDLLQAGEVEIGMVATDVLWEAYNGKYTYEGNPKDKLRTLMPGWPGVYQFVTLAKYGIDDVTDFDGKTFSAGPVGSSVEAFCNYVFDLFGVKPKITNLPNADAARALGDGTIQGFSLSWPAPAVTELEATHDIRIITLTEEQRAKFAERYPQYPILKIPPGAYKALPNGAVNPGLYNFVCVRADLPEDFVYTLVKTIYEHQDIVSKTWAEMGNGMALENVTYATAPYHPGAVRYFQEKGIKLPDELIPPEMK